MIVRSFAVILLFAALACGQATRPSGGTSTPSASPYVLRYGTPTAGECGVWLFVSGVPYLSSAACGSGGGLPDQTGQNGKYLTTNGTAASWATISAESPLTFTAPLIRAVNTISLAAANGSTDGYLTSANFNTFNGKAATGSCSANQVATATTTGGITCVSLTSSYLPATTAYTGQANSWGAFKQTFTPSASVAGANFACTTLPSTPVNGDIACDSADSNQIKVRSNGAWVTVTAGGGGGMADPGGNGIIKRTALNTTAQATATDVAAVMACSASGTNTLACSLSPAIASYATNSVYWVQIANDNTTAVTLNINSLGAKTIKRRRDATTVDLIAGDLRTGQIANLIYNGTDFVLVSPPGNSAGYAMVLGASGGVAASSTSYLAHQGQATGSDASRRIMVPAAGTVTKFYAFQMTTQGSGGNQVCTLRKNGAGLGTPSTFSITVPLNATVGSTYSDTAETGAVVAGDLLNVECINSHSGTGSIILFTIWIN